MLKKIFALALFGLFAQTLAAKELPDFTALVEKQGAAVVNVSTSQIVQSVPGRTANSWFARGRSAGRVIPPFRLAHAARAGIALAGLRFHHQCGRLHPDQCACRGCCRQDHRAPDRQARIQGQGDRCGQAHRCGAAQDRGDAVCPRSLRATRRYSRWANGCWRSARHSVSTAA